MCNSFEPENLITRDDCLLVIIDAQEKLTPALSQSDEMAANLVRLARFSRIVGIPVIVTEQEKLGATLAVIKDCLPDMEPVKKVHFNCFSSHDFNDRVLASGKKTIILTGAEAHICVAQTALGGAFRVQGSRGGRRHIVPRGPKQGDRPPEDAARRLGHHFH